MARRITYKIRAIWKIIWSKSFIVVAGSGGNFLSARVSTGCDDPVFDAALDSIHDAMTTRAKIAILHDEAARAVDKLKNKLEIP